MVKIYKEEIFTCFECKHAIYLKQFGMCCTRMEETDNCNDIILDNFPEIPDNCPLEDDCENISFTYNEVRAIKDLINIGFSLKDRSGYNLELADDVYHKIKSMRVENG